MGATRLLRLIGLSVAAALALVAPGRASGQSISARRFEIVAVGDTTFDFAVRDQRWVKPRARGIAVDPRQRDALIAQFEVLSVRDGVATAVVTGATTRVTLDHVAQLEPPRQRWWRNGGTWAGLGLGLVAGVLVGASM
ncbi:MAG TPA: hypothetical protein VKA84_20750 [Gemmatimonadaceae bacterium]|nr:hypothetical protein [Gemmatimonadaceae bacterium]